MARVLITTRIFTANPVEEALDILREAGHEPVIASVPGAYLEAEGLHRQLAGIAGAMASSEPYTAETFRMFPDLQVIARLGVGYDAIDLEAFRDTFEREPAHRPWKDWMRTLVERGVLELNARASPR